LHIQRRIAVFAAKIKISKSLHKQLQEWAFSFDGLNVLQRSDEFAAILRKLPQYNGVLWRGGTMPQVKFNKLKSMKTLKFNTNISFSFDIETTRDYVSLGGVPYLYKINNGKGADLTKLDFDSDVFEYNKEIVIPKNTRFNIIKISKYTGSVNYGKRIQPYLILLTQLN
jgi:hypothetical protein